MSLGKGVFVWQLWNCAGGDIDKLIQKAKNRGFTWVAIKIADGRNKYKQSRYFWQTDMLPEAVRKFKQAGFGVWGWHFVYGYYPEREARVAVEQVNTYDLDGYIIDAEAYYKGRYVQANTFVNVLRSEMNKSVDIALCSYRYPSYHPSLPWDEFLSISDLHMPQVYWEGSHNPGHQLTRSVRELLELKMLPVVPVGSAYARGSWTPTIQDLDEFHDTAKDLSLPGISWWSWQHMESTRTPEGMFMLDIIGSQIWEDLPPTPYKTVELRLAGNFDTNMNIRSEPRIADNKVGLLPSGSVVPVLNEVVVGDDIWFKIGWEQYVASVYQGRTYMEYVRE